MRDANAVTRRLDQTRAKYDDLVLVHGGGPGTDRLAAQWAERHGVDQVVPATASMGEITSEHRPRHRDQERCHGGDKQR